MSNGRLMIGTKFYRYTGASEYIETIRLIKQEGDKIIFNLGGYRTYLTDKDMDMMIANGDFKFIGNGVYELNGELPNGRLYKQKWTLLDSEVGHDIFIHFTVESIKIKLTMNELKANYIRLIPDGMATIGCPRYIGEGGEKNKSVMLAIHKDDERLPYIICRPDAVDIFSAPALASTFNMPMGVTVSKRTLPKGMNIMQFMTADKIESFKAIAIYIDDAINSIMKCFGSINTYNAVMRRIYDSYTQTPGLILKSNNLHALFNDTGLYDEIRDMFGLFVYPFKLDTSKSKMTEAQAKTFSRLIAGDPNRYVNIEYCPYDKSVDLCTIDRPHILINTGDQNWSDIFLVTYDEM